MRRHEALIPLTHDHHHALVQVRKLKSAAKGSEDVRRATAEEFIDFFFEETLNHFHEEERVIGPLVAYEDEIRVTWERLLQEHVLIHALVLGLQRENDQGVASADTLRELATTLQRHIRLEEKVLFPLIQTVVDDAALQEIALRPRHRARAS